ncbi:MAG: FecR family protein, partial [Sphingomonas ginsenosidimutans]|nr:FecR family protein [Sphingomonas ginsenosidimutans]
MRRALAVLLAASCSTQALAGPAGWTISEASGPVTIARAGVSTVATRGGAVSAGDVVSTGRGGRAVLVRGTEFMMVAPGSRLRLPAEAQPAGVTRVIEELGNVVFMIKKKMTPHFEVKTPYLAAVVKGTTFSVGVSGAGTSVQVLEGAVDVATLDGGAHDLVTPGAVAMVAAGNRMRMTIEENGRTRVLESSGAGESEPAPAAVPVVAEQTASREGEGGGRERGRRGPSRGSARGRGRGLVAGRGARADRGGLCPGGVAGDHHRRAGIRHDRRGRRHCRCRRRDEDRDRGGGIDDAHGRDRKSDRRGARRRGRGCRHRPEVGDRNRHRGAGQGGGGTPVGRRRGGRDQGCRGCRPGEGGGRAAQHREGGGRRGGGGSGQGRGAGGRGSRPRR